ncbi:MAG: lipase maturation factor family protein [Acidobacteriaceae bacterium]
MQSVAATYFGEVWLTRLLIQRGMAAIYLVAFLVALRQFRPLLGERGLMPVPAFLENVSFWQAPSLFQWRYSDRLADGVAWTGIVISGCAVLGLTETGPIWVSIAAWLVLWALYLSIVNVGQSFYGFGWESMLLEAGLFTAFLGPASVQAPLIPVIALRWMLFRTEVGAGLIKLRNDRCWRDLTCMFYHYETQPLPNPLSWYFHRLPATLHRFSALASHFVQIVAPFALFAPQPAAEIAGGLIILHQFWLIMSGNYSWLNWLTVILGVAACSDRALALVMPMHGAAAAARPLDFDVALYVLAAATVVLSVRPALNLLSRHQVMNTSYNRFHLVNSYGAFGRVGRRRFEIVIEGTQDAAITQATVWREYEFRAKPGDPLRRPPQIAPWHLRLDWMIWFLSFSVALTADGVRVAGYPIWFLRLLKRLLEGDAAMLRLIGRNPFPDRPPAWARARYYEYGYTTGQERRATGAWWSRRLLGDYLQPVALRTLEKV